MNSTKLLWRTAGIVGLIATLVFVFGFFYAIKEIVYPQAEAEGVPQQTAAPQNELPADGQLHILALGDSLTYGTGDEAGGQGYVGRVKKLLEQQTKKPVFVWNNAVNGYTTVQLLNFIKQPNQAEYFRKADIILLTIGGNDLNRVGALPASQQGNTGEQPGVDYAAIAKQLPAAEGRLKQILTTIETMNPKARIVYIGLYYPYLDQDPDGAGFPILQDWNDKAAALAAKYRNLTVVPTYDLFQRDEARFLYLDHFHPNQYGYDRIAQRVFQALQ